MPRMPERYRTATGQIDIAKLKQDVSIAEVAAMVTTLRRSGEDEMKGLCPLHHENTPSFCVNDAKGLFHCFGCNRGGDVIALVQQIGHQGFVESCEWLVGSEWTTSRAARPSIMEAREKRQSNIARAKAEWRLGEPVAGTLPETYLKSRGIVGAVPHCVRFAMVPRFWGDDGHEGQRLPAMIASAQDVDGRVVGIQRTFLDPRGRKARGGEPRLSLGQMRGSALRLGPASPEIMLAVGVEDALSLTRMFPGRTVWSAFGDANLAHVVLPSAVRRVVLCGDDDEAGRAAVAIAAEAFRDRRLEVAELFPKAGCKDFNEEWLMLHA